MADPRLEQFLISIRKASPFIILLMGLLLFNNTVSAQELPVDSVSSDTLKRAIKIQPPHSPKKASILSAVLPGAGQIYNRQYWKAPIFWAGLGISAYFIVDNTKEFKGFKQAYVLRSDTLIANDPAAYSKYTLSGLREGTEFYRRRRDLSYASFALFYLLNIVEASVGAHLFYFDVDENVSLNVQPYQYQSTQPAYGLRLTLNF